MSKWLNGIHKKRGDSRLCFKKTQNYDAYVWLDDRPVALVKAHAQTACNSNTFTIFVVDGIYAYIDDALGLPHFIYNTGNTLQWSGDFYGFGSPFGSGLANPGGLAAPMRAAPRGGHGGASSQGESGDQSQDGQ